MVVDILTPMVLNDSCCKNLPLEHIPLIDTFPMVTRKMKKAQELVEISHFEYEREMHFLLYACSLGRKIISSYCVVVYRQDMTWWIFWIKNIEERARNANFCCFWQCCISMKIENWSLRALLGVQIEFGACSGMYWVDPVEHHPLPDPWWPSWVHDLPSFLISC